MPIGRPVGGGVDPLLAVEVGERVAAPFDAGKLVGAGAGDVHDGARVEEKLAGLAKDDLIGESGDEDAAGKEARERGIGGARKQEKQTGGEKQDAGGDGSGEGGEAGMKAALSGARFDSGVAYRAADFAAGERGDGEEEIAGEEGEEVEVDREDGARRLIRRRR